MSEQTPASKISEFIMKRRYEISLHNIYKPYLLPKDYLNKKIFLFLIFVQGAQLSLHLISRVPMIYMHIIQQHK